MKIPYTIVDDFDNVFDERNNVFLSLRKIVWGENENPEPESVKLDLRRWGVDADGNECPHKGFSFLTDEGPHELARVLIENNFGHTNEILEDLSKRDDFETCLNEIVGEDSKFYNKNAKTEDFYDPSDDDAMFDYD